MNKRPVPLAVAIAFVLGCVATSAFKIPLAHAQVKTRWEYSCASFEYWKTDKSLAAEWNKFGAEGWEMVVSVAASGGATQRVCFKRPAAATGMPAESAPSSPTPG